MFFAEVIKSLGVSFLFDKFGVCPSSILAFWFQRPIRFLVALLFCVFFCYGTSSEGHLSSCLLPPTKQNRNPKIPVEPGLRRPAGLDPAPFLKELRYLISALETDERFLEPRCRQSRFISVSYVMVMQGPTHSKGPNYNAA